MNILIDLFDHSGHASAPYEKNNWHVLQVDIKHGIDILTWDYKNTILDLMADLNYIKPNTIFRFGILAAIPCTDFALCGAVHFAKKDANGETDKSQELVAKTKEIIDWVNSKFNLVFWRIENPMSRIHSLNPWMGKITHKFNPCDYAGYNNISQGLMDRFNYLRTLKISEVNKMDIKLVMDADLYNKATWLWGSFNIPLKKPIPPVWKEFPGHVIYGGKSERTKELRSVDPVGFCTAFFEANN